MQFHNTTETQSAPFSCEYCGQKYTRLDHLTRHIRSHTQERPFKCQECGKDFARVDLLKRHLTGHESSLKSNKRQKTSHHNRPRAARACVACARSKLRCDGEDNCSRCLKRNVECIYKKSANSTHDAPVDIPQNDSTTSATINHATGVPERGSTTVHWDSLTQLSTPLEHPNLPDIAQHTNQRGRSDIVEANTEIPEENQPSVTSASNVDFDDTYLADFLRDILHPSASHADYSLVDHQDPTFAPKDFLDFTVPSSFEYLDNLDLSQLGAIGEQSNPQLPPDNARQDALPVAAARSGYATPTSKTGLSLSAQAFKESLWLWTPQQGDHGQAESVNLSLPVGELISRERADLGDPFFPVISQVARDRVLATVLGNCEQTMTTTIVSCFPSAELLTVLIHRWATNHRVQTDTWFHLAHFDPNQESAELLIAMIGAGAVLSKDHRLRKLGYAFQEAGRAANGGLFEADNRNIRKLRPIQTLCLTLDVGLWSGDRRKVEIAEGFAGCLVTMVRRGGYFAKIDDFMAPPSIEDDPAALDRKWKSWIETESLRRVVTHMIIRDSQSSASLLSPPLISFAELTSTLPAPRRVWDASSAQEWFHMLTNITYQPFSGVSSLRNCLNDLQSAATYRQQIDSSLTVLAISHGLWGLCWQHRQIDAVSKQPWDDPHRTNGMHATSSSKQLAVQKLQQFRLIAAEWQDFQADATMVCERVLMNLHVSLEDVQLFAGKGGEREARRIFPTLRQWAQSSDARQAIWHAGQIVRAAYDLPIGALREAAAVAVYHAGLVFWAYAIITNVDKPDRQESEQTYEVCLNGDTGPHLERFVMLGRGTPFLKNWYPGPRAGQIVYLQDAKKVMSILVELLQAKNETRGEECPPLIGNLNKLMRSLGNAARSIRNI